MNNVFFLRRLAVLAAAVVFTSSIAPSAELLPQGARLAIIGDSITEQKLYSKHMEAYLLACAGRQDIKVFQFGWGGETAGGFAGRLENDLAFFQPTVVTTCYGMNDGQYRPYADDIGRPYEENMRRVVAGLQKAGVKTVVLGSPGAVDTKYFVRPNFAPLSGADGYNKNLATLRDIDKRLAAEFSATPFDAQFRKVLDAVAAKQNFETALIKSFVTNFRQFAREAQKDAELAQAFKTAAQRLMARQAELDGATRQAIVPIQHKISVAPAS